MGNATDQKRIEAQERRARAVQLRRMGWSYSRIAGQLGMTKSSVHKAVTKALTDVQKELDADADLLRAQELERLDELQSYYWITASKGNFQAGDRILKIMERRARLLGLDAPTKLAPTNGDGEDAPATGVVMVPAPAASIEEWVQQAQAHQSSKDEQ